MVGTSVIVDYQLLFKGSKTGSYLTIEPKEGSSVPVAVWSVSETDELALDRYEGYPSFYYKKELQIPITGIRTGKVRVRKAFVYIMHEERPLGLPSCGTWQLALRDTDPLVLIKENCGRHMPTAKGRCENGMQD